MADNQDRSILFRRILVAVDTSETSRAALESAAALARIMESEIRGLFVHEEHWNQISRLPTVQTVNELTGETQGFEQDALKHQLETLESRLRQQLKYISRRNEVSHSWQSVHGRVAEKVLEAAKDADLITIGRRGRSYKSRNKLGSTAKAVIRKAEKPVLILKERLNLRHSITAVYDASEESHNGLRLALSLAKENRSQLTIIVVKHEQTDSERDTDLEQLIDDAQIRIRVKVMKKPNLRDFVNTINSQPSGLIVIPKNQPFLQEGSMEIMLTYILSPVLMMT